VNERSQLMSQAVEEALRHSRELLSVCSSVGNQFGLGRESEGVQLLQFLIGGLGCISEAVHLTIPLQERRNVRISLEDLPGTLESLVAALESKDYDRVGDIVACEIRPVLEDWSHKLSELNRAESVHDAVHESRGSIADASNDEANPPSSSRDKA
jgi:hypothetical protein